MKSTNKTPIEKYQSTERDLSDVLSEVGIDELLEDVTFLAGCVNRYKMLQQITEKPRSAPEIEEELGVSQATRQRNLQKLEEEYLISYSPTEHQFSRLPAGQILIEAFEDLLASVHTANKLKSFYSHLPETVQHEFVDLDLQTLQSCRITVGGTVNPYLPMKRVLSLIRRSDQLYWFAPMINPLYAESIETQVSHGLEYESVGTENVYKGLKADHPSVFDTFSKSKTAQLLVSDTLPEFNVGLLDDRIFIIAYDQHMRTHSVLEATTEHRPVYEWGKRLYSMCRQEAELYG